MAEENRQHRRYQQNLQGLLQLAVDAGSASEEPAPAEPMSEERKAWLREALADVAKGQLDEVEQLKQCLAVLQQERKVEEEEDDDVEEKESAFEMLSELCENLDNARDLMVLGGLELCVSRYLSHSQSGLRWRAAELLALCAQNMPQLQIHLLSIGTLPKLLQLTDADPHPTVRVKALYALSCLVREQDAGIQAFLSHDGFSVLMRGMQSEHEKLRTKSAFLLLNLLTSHPEHKATVRLHGYGPTASVCSSHAPLTVSRACCWHPVLSGGGLPTGSEGLQGSCSGSGDVPQTAI
ncbi:unnamed protein product [Tetraodon nigroviridis]|uniref:Chromosome undetermined SCAF14696, whole genome shotgun sequence n=1 Tax=Tetraodon nigroviridis TaxID=99883 RepID=Q4S9G9_TETNG|nr:unnamed protein product [Tetraodon nigroviridis]